MSQTFNTLQVSFQFGETTKSPKISRQRIKMHAAVWTYTVKLRPDRLLVVSGHIKDSQPTTEHLDVAICHPGKTNEWERKEQVTDFKAEIID